jgi:hypothetical protein
MSDRHAYDSTPRHEVSGKPKTIQEIIDAGLATTFLDAKGTVRIRLTDKGWALAEQLKKERGDDVG